MPHQDYIGSDGKQWPSATELTNLLPQAWLWSWYKSSVKKHGWRGWQKCRAESERGKKIGSNVHALIEGFIAKTPNQPFDKYGSQMFADKLFDKVAPMVDEWVEIEPHLKSETEKIHGTADCIVRLDYSPGLWIGDWKTSAQRSLTHPVQLAVYAMCWNEMHPDQQIDQAWIARVDKKSVRLTVHIDEYKGLKRYYPVVRALRTIWEYNQGDKKEEAI